MCEGVSTQPHFVLINTYVRTYPYPYIRLLTDTEVLEWLLTLVRGYMVHIIVRTSNKTC